MDLYFTYIHSTQYIGWFLFFPQTLISLPSRKLTHFYAHAWADAFESVPCTWAQSLGFLISGTFNAYYRKNEYLLTNQCKGLKHLYMHDIKIQIVWNSCTRSNVFTRFKMYVHFTSLAFPEYNNVVTMHLINLCIQRQVICVLLGYGIDIKRE